MKTVTLLVLSIVVAPLLLAADIHCEKTTTETDSTRKEIITYTRAGETLLETTHRISKHGKGDDLLHRGFHKGKLVFEYSVCRLQGVEGSALRCFRGAACDVVAPRAANGRLKSIGLIDGKVLLSGFRAKGDFLVPLTDKEVSDVNVLTAGTGIFLEELKKDISGGRGRHNKEHRVGR